ncbi:MAG: GNAT family N-acetyltransferase [Meiothermus sp.]|nr:GNAT family N-acetyltransferase [Meiothermus sp.]
MRQLSAGQLEPLIPEFVALLQDVVDGGASVGFLPPLSEAEAAGYWRDVLEAIRGPGKLLWGAFEGGRLVGTIQLNLETRANGIHRAEIAKVMVHTTQRRRGIARLMMEVAEAEALRLGRTTLVLDTLEGHAAVLLYESLGWRTAGVIPKYAIYQDGEQHGTVVMYKLL